MFSSRKPIPSNLENYVPHPGEPRLTPAAAPHTLARHETPPGPTPLQKHVGFWDRNKDGVIWPWETFQGFYALGFNPFVSLVSALAFHILHVSYYTHDSWILNPLFPVYIKNIHWAKHGSDTETYDTEGRFVTQKFEEIFSKYDHNLKGGLSFSDLVIMWRGNRNVLDFVGWAFQLFLWTYLWCLAADPVTGILAKEDVLKQYDGTLYYELEERRKQGEKLPWYRGGTGLGWGKGQAKGVKGGVRAKRL